MWQRELPQATATSTHPPTHLPLCPYTLPSLLLLGANCPCFSGGAALCTCALDLIIVLCCLHYQCFLYGKISSAYKHIIHSIFKKFFSWCIAPSSYHLSSLLFLWNSKTPQKSYFLTLTLLLLCTPDPTLHMLYILLQTTQTALLKVASKSPNPTASSQSSHYLIRSNIVDQSLLYQGVYLLHLSSKTPQTKGFPTSTLAALFSVLC